MKRLFAALASFLLFLALVLGLALYGLLATEPGLRLLVRLAETEVPALDIAEARGTLAGGFGLKGLAWRDAGTEVLVEELDWAWDPAALWRHRLHIRSLRLRGVKIALSGEKEGTEPPAWPRIRLPLEVQLDDGQLREGSLVLEPGAEPIRVNQLDTALVLDAAGLRLDRLAVEAPEASATLAGFVGFGDEPALGLKTDWRLHLPGRPPVRAGGTVTGDPARLVLSQHVTAPVTGTVRAEVLDPLGRLTWTAQIETPPFALNRLDPGWPPWPLALNLDGKGDSEQAAVTGMATGNIPELGELRARLDLAYRYSGELAVRTLNLGLPRTDTELALQGTAQPLAATPAFDLSARWRNLLWPPEPKAEWRSPEGTLRLAGNLQDFRFTLNGRLRDRPVEASGNLGIEPETLVFREVQAHGAGTDLAVNGVIGPRLDLAWTLKAEDLGLWWPELQGRIDSTGTLAGTRGAPAVEADLSALNLRFGNHGADRLTLNARAGLAADAPLRFELAGENVRIDGHRLDVALEGLGTRERHRLAGRVQSPPYRLALELDGGWLGPAWAGTLARFDVTEPWLGDWALRRPAPLKLAAAAGELGTACWRHQTTELCLAGGLAERSQWRATADLSRLPLARLAEKFGPGATVAGFLEATARLSGTGTRVDHGRVTVTAMAPKVNIPLEGRTLTLAPEQARLEADIAQKGGELRLAVEQAGLLSIQGGLRLAGPLDPARLGQAPIDGELRARIESLAVADPWLDEVEAVEGALTAELHLGGTPAAPALRGRTELTGAGFLVPRLGIRVRDLALDARTDEQRQLKLAGRATSGGGRLALEGEWHWAETAGRPPNLRIRGEKFLAADLPEARVYLSPDLVLAYTDRTATLTGQVGVPEAAITLPERTGAVTPSEDVVMVDGEDREQESGLALEARIDVILGNRVRLKGAGFDGTLDGHVLVEQAPNQPVLGTGQIVVKEGGYAFAGTRLDLKDARILYARSPIDNPNLDVNVDRRAGNVTAGVRVTGPLKNPVINLYSDPAMAQADILAYLVTGKALNFASGEEGSLVRQAAVSLGGSAGTLVAREITDRLGLGGFFDDIGVQTLRAPETGAPTTPQDTTRNAALFLGKYLTPRLYVQYGVGLFQTSNVFRLTYQLGEHWKLQSETGTYSGGDLLFEWAK
jgi:translocation and assembly module TamB